MVGEEQEPQSNSDKNLQHEDVCLLMINFSSSTDNHGFLLWIMRWQLGQTHRRSFSFVFSPCFISETGTSWWISQKSRPLSPYTSSKSNPHASHITLVFLFLKSLILLSLFFLLLSCLLWIVPITRPSDCISGSSKWSLSGNEFPSLIDLLISSAVALSSSCLS